MNYELRFFSYFCTILFSNSFVEDLNFDRMKTIQVKGKRFRVSITEATILAAVDKVADRIKADYADKNPLFVVVLNGAFMFAADLMKRVNIPCAITFLKLSSYQGTETTGNIREDMSLYVDVKDRHVVIVEDIVDTGYTMEYLYKMMKTRGAASTEMCTLLFKPEKLEVGQPPKYVAISIPNDFIIGYGLDYDEAARNLPDIYTLTED